MSYCFIWQEYAKGRMAMAKGRHKLLSAERENVVLKLIESGCTGISEISRHTGVSEATVRRDLLSLERSGKVRRVHGGALKPPVSAPPEPLYAEKAARNAAAKEKIAGLALKMVEDTDSIYLDGGSTLQSFARLLARRKNLVIVTNSLAAATELLDSGHRIILVGGELRIISRTIVGAMTKASLENLHIDKAFLGTIGLSRGGISTTDPNEAFTKELVMRRSNKVYVLADSSKLGVESLAFSGSLGDVDALVTDRHVPSDLAAALRKNGVDIFC